MSTAHSTAVPVAVGIDVAKATLSVCIRTAEGTERALTIRNTDADVNTILVPRLAGCSGSVVMESTGHYHWTPALSLRAQGFDVRVVNPLLSKQYTAGNIRKVKTDPADARSLAHMAAVDTRLPPPFTVSTQELSMRKTLATIGSMGHQVQALSASLKSMREAQAILGASDTEAIRTLEASIKTLKLSLAALERECVATASADTAQQKTLALLTSIPGVSDFCATLALNWFTNRAGVTDKSWVAFAGLDVSSRESGTWRGRCKLTKRGNAFLRKRLYSAAWGAVMNHDIFRMYYDTLRGAGRVHTEALIIIARKIVRTMFAVLQSETPFDMSKFQYGKAHNA